MIELSRTVRFCLNDPPHAGAEGPRSNNFSAFPAMRGLGRFYQLHVRCRGEPDPLTGYLVNIKEVDAAFRAEVLPLLQQTLEAEPDAAEVAMGELMRQILFRLQPPLNHTVISAQLELTPFYRLEIGNADMSTVMMRQQYEFAAAHRLHVSELSDAENRKVFGKCNNPHGHGHNYRVEVAVRVPIDPKGRVFYVEQLDEIVDELCIDRLDHKNLNVDVPEFAHTNSSVENIAAVIYDMLRGPLAAHLQVELEEVSVWETGKTVCTYRGEAHNTSESPRSEATTTRS